VIVVFTKFDQFKLDIEFQLEDEDAVEGTDIDAEVEKKFDQYYRSELSSLSQTSPFIRLERMHQADQQCIELLKMTADQLSDSIVALMLFAVQKDNLKLNINQAVEWTLSTFKQGSGSTEAVIERCIMAFPSLWYYLSLIDDLDDSDFFDVLNFDRLDSFLRKRFRFRDDDDDLDDDDDRGSLKSLFLNLRSLVTSPPFSKSSDTIHHTMIVTILLLEGACLFYASSARPTLNKALNMAHSQYVDSNIFEAVMEQFSATPEEYSALQFTEFILKNHLHQLGLQPIIV